MKNFIRAKEEEKMTKEETPVQPKQTPEVAPVEPKAQASKDAEMVAQWETAATAAPSEDQVSQMREHLAKLKAEAATLEDKFAEAVVTRACVFGFQRVAAEQETTAKQIHTWKKTFLPEMPDLSAIPDKEMKREERRIATLNARLEAEKELKRKRDEHQARLNKLREMNQK